MFCYNGNDGMYFISRLCVCVCLIHIPIFASLSSGTYSVDSKQWISGSKGMCIFNFN